MDMKIRTWTARSHSDYEARVQPKIHALFSSLDENSSHVEEAIAEAVHGLMGEQEAETVIRIVLIAQDLRFLLRSAQGAFPSAAVYQHVQNAAKDEQICTRTWKIFAEQQPKHQRIWRILAPVEFACVDLSGKKVTLLFRRPFACGVQRTIGALAQRLHIEHEEIIY